jgi:hypothetical protein
MKNLPYILLLTLFSHTLVWGQDDDFLKFRSLELDTLHQIPPSNEREDFFEDDRLLVTHFVNKGEVYIFFKRKKFFEAHFFMTYFINSQFDSVYLSPNKQFLLIKHSHFVRANSATNSLSIIDINRRHISTIEENYHVGEWSNRDDDTDYIDSYYSESNSEINFDGFQLTIKSEVFTVEEVYLSDTTISSDTLKNYNPYDGEYHYINGNFVKVKTYINQHTFTNTAYDLGEKTYLTPECAFYFECDCCSEHLLFTSDSTFVVVAPCTQDVSVSYGRYEVIDNALHLHFSGIWQERYMVSDEPNKPSEYAYRTNTIPPHTAIFTPEICKNTTLFTEQSNPNHKLLRSQETLEEHLEYLKKVGLWK